MSIESVIEGTIKAAMARGEFDNLEGAGKPLDLSAYFSTPEDEQRADLTKQLHQKQLAVTIALEEYKRRSNL